jgi:small subunit ribosomal protein S15
LAEQGALNAKVGGPSPSRGTNMLTPEEKEKIIKKYKLHEADTGSPEVQVTLLTEEIKKLLLHLKRHSKDFHSKRGLLKMVSKRRKLLNYLKKENIRRHNSLIKKIGLKK